VNLEYQAQIIVNTIKIFLKIVIFKGQTLSIHYSITKNRVLARCGKILELFFEAFQLFLPPFTPQKYLKPCQKMAP
jgi:hypothetical protein